MGAGWAWGGMLCVVSRARWTEPRAESIERVIVRSAGSRLFSGWLLANREGKAQRDPTTAKRTEPRAESISRVIVRSSGCGLFCGWLLVSGSDRMIFRSIF